MNQERIAARQARTRELFATAGLYCLTSEEHSRGRGNIAVVRRMIAAGVKIIQYREKNKTALEKYRECLEIRQLTRQAGVTFIVNDDIAIAMAVCADGVHVGQDDLPVAAVRQLVGDDMIIGLSTHSSEQAQEAAQAGADYIGVGPVYKTFTKKDVGDPVGLEYLEYVTRHMDIPFVAIGGIKLENVAELTGRGVKCIAMITEIVGRDDIEAAIAEVRQAMQG